MTIVGFHASHEQLPPARLLHAVQRAEGAGFDAAMCSDHLAPWSVRQGESGFAWSWLGAAMQATGLPFGVVTAPGQRYHPTLTAQAAATLASMFPGRFWAALGSGEAINEHVTGEPFPPKEERDARLRETVDVIRRLLRGEEVTTDGLVRVDRARIWSLPDVPPPLIIAAVSAETARDGAEWADGLITVDQPRHALRDVIDAYRDAGGHGPTAVQVHLSWAPTDEEARAIAHEQWRSGLVPAPLAWELDTPQAFDERTADATPDDVARTVQVSADPARHLAKLTELAELGFDRIYLHHVGTEQDAFIDTFGEHVLPALKAVGR
ncbi:TIGR03885 family FMN-dependent LLM class oxidoreductase [Agromyces sp. ISL-38]|uniref:TIGR03885 family FMN-dependent LLM class oxidoreductase n=1 Tax=Agromyces sp. ISL-38 TaxID=2819107 RepID=UPI001BE4EFB9|nr:TIGR03885 family FMN-dependent LLM class oxidoreductase [Agromyces sp. ISL-38]MBT2499691.1 TIGR03885 family FMN-dependent LLM class oxidoreductase [Agromyces sp. ISL-38]MBT2516161.1 TIGR03885 family FMN-dependent LLM class oxidoreductase [Streptomyces sp. ISL-90]